MRKLTQFSVDYPITIMMLVLGILLLGYISFQKLGIDLFPDLNNPRIFVEIQAGERPPEEMEKQFVQNIESLAIRQKKVVRVSSVSRVGAAQITVEYSWDADMDEAFLDLQKSLTSFSQNSDLDELNITQHDPNAAPVMLLGLSHPEITDMDELRKVSQNYLRNELIRLDGIAEVELLGFEEKEVIIRTNNYLLEAYNLTPSMISSRIDTYNRNVSGGSIVEMGLKYIIKGVGEFGSLEDIGDVIVTYKQENTQTVGSTTQGSNTERVPIYLKDVADIDVRINQTRCMGLSIYKETKFNTVKAVDNLLESLADLQKALPGYELVVIQNQGEFITTAIEEVQKTALIGIGLAVLVLFVFLRRIGTTAIISLAIPISIVATFNLMYFNGLTLNIMTLGGLALGAGMLVDNAIVVMENIYRKLESGIRLRDAAIQGTAQVGGAVTASTVTTIVVFLPIVYLHGAAGELFKDQAWTVAFSLMSSLVVAILVIPMLSMRFLKSASVKTPKHSIHFPRYRNFLSKTLNRRWQVITIAAALIAFAAYLVPIIGSEFIPKTDLNEFSIELKLPEGTELFRTEKTVSNLEIMITEILGDNLLTIYSKIGPSTDMTGGGEAFFEDENTATIKIVLKKERTISSNAVTAQIGGMLDNIPDLEAQFIQEQTALQSTLGVESAPLVVEVKGEDLEVISGLAEQVKQQLLGMKELFNVESSFDEGRPQVEVVLDRVRIGLYNIGMNQISTQMKEQLSGAEAGQWDHEGEMKDITLRLPNISINQLEDMIIQDNDQKIRLADIANISITKAPREIIRNNQSRTGKVTAHLRTNKPFNQVVSQVRERIRQISFPPEYKYDITGEEQKRRETFESLRFALFLSIILTYMVLASQFESLVHPFTILLTIPLAGVGAILIFFLLGQSLNIMAFIGIIMLVGIAVNDSIILVDAINQLRREGKAVGEAILDAGQRRIRPIIMTSLTTILALLPLTIGIGEGAALRAPMALAVIGGLITSTILTLIVIPCVYSVLDRLSRKTA